MSEDVLYLKIESLQRTLARLGEYNSRPSPEAFEKDTFRQDALSANLLRLAQQSVDLANYAIRLKGLGIPKTSGDSFDILYRSDILTAQITQSLIALVGFRNVYLHEYAGFEPRFILEAMAGVNSWVGALIEGVLKLFPREN